MKESNIKLPPTNPIENDNSVEIQQFNSDGSFGKPHKVTYKPGFAEAIRVIDGRPS
jgi:hypothetical protein